MRPCWLAPGYRTEGPAAGLYPCALMNDMEGLLASCIVGIEHDCGLIKKQFIGDLQ
jgi:hypothetical protein